jgi:hypothetical protein
MEENSETSVELDSEVGIQQEVFVTTTISAEVHEVKETRGEEEEGKDSSPEEGEDPNSNTTNVMNVMAQRDGDGNSEDSEVDPRAIMAAQSLLGELQQQRSAHLRIHHQIPSSTISNPSTTATTTTTTTTPTTTTTHRRTRPLGTTTRTTTTTTNKTLLQILFDVVWDFAKE